MSPKKYFKVILENGLRSMDYGSRKKYPPVQIQLKVSNGVG